MSIDLNDFLTDTKKEVEGVKVPLGDGSWIKVACSSNNAYVNRMSELLEGQRVLMDLGGDKADELAKDMLYTAAAEHLLLDWCMLVDGEEVKYTPEVGKNAFSKAPRFYRMVKDNADSLSLFSLKKEVQETKNSRKPHSGK